MSHPPIYQELIQLLNENIVTFNFEHKNILSVANQIGDARLVLMGEASHGTKEFYDTRIALTQYLIKEKGFHAIAIEGDWPSAHQVHRYIQGLNQNEENVLNGFQRFPNWMWRNKSIQAFIPWLRNHNNQSPENKVGFYGLDLYCLHDSMNAIISYLKKHQPDAVANATTRFSCFDHTTVDPQVYGYLVNQQIKHACIHEVTEQLLEMQHHTLSEMHKNKLPDHDADYYALQNARVVKNAEKYYRSLFEPRDVSWNIRDQHMAETLSNIISHIESNLKTPAKIIVWAHNSHVGDARATEMHDRNEINLGQIVREQYDTASYLLGFSTYDGTVRAASEWDGPSIIKKVSPSLPGSYEFLFHDANEKNFFLNLRAENHLTHLLKNPELQRAIGVIYLPQTERMSHYYFSRLPYQFDGIIHFDRTQAVVPLDREPFSEMDELPETYPTGI